MPQFIKEKPESQMFAFLKNQKYTDIVLTAESNMVNAHKLILAASSKYFEALFDALKEKCIAIVLKDIKMKSLLLILEFVYCGQVEVPDADVDEFIESAKSLQIEIGTPKFEANDTTLLNSEVDHSDEDVTMNSRQTSLIRSVGKAPEAPESTLDDTILDCMMNPSFDDLGDNKSVDIQPAKPKSGTTRRRLKPTLKSGLFPKLTSESYVPKCDFCNCKFREKDRTYHQRHCFKNPGRIASDCSECQKKCENPSRLRLHMRKFHPETEFDMKKRTHYKKISAEC